MEFAKGQLEIAAYYVVDGSNDHGWMRNLAEKILGQGEHGQLDFTEAAILRKAWGKRKEEDIELVRQEFNAGR